MATQMEYNHENIKGAELDGVSRTVAANISGELGTTSITSITDNGDGKYHVELETDGGFTAFGGGRCTYAIKSVIGRGEPETISLHIVKKRV